MSAQGKLPLQSSVQDRDGRRRESVATRVRGACATAAFARVNWPGTTSGTATCATAGASYAADPLREIAMRCLPHVFLRGGLALLLLATVGVSAWAWPAHSCGSAVHAAAATSAASAHC